MIMNDTATLQKQNVEDILALSPVQEGMLFHYLSEPESELYFEQLSFKITGKLDVQVFKQSWNFVAGNNELLRTVYRWQKLHRPVQIILKRTTLPFIEHDLTHVEVSDREKCIEEIKERDRQERLDLCSSPIRIILCKLSEAEYEMTISHYHIILDGWSNGILLKEFLEAYNSLCTGKQPDKPIKSRYKEFIKWQSSQDKGKQLDFWQGYFKGFENKTLLPLDRKKQEDQPVDTKTYVQCLSSKEIKEIKEFIRKENVTLATLFYSAWGIQLQKYNDCTDVVFGTTVSGRTPEINGIENMVGLFINTIPFRAKAESSCTVRKFMISSERDLRERNECEHTPQLDIRTCTELDKSENIFDSIVVIENYPIGKVSEKNTAINISFSSIFEMTNFELTLVISTFDKIELRFIYDANVFDRKTLKRISEHFMNIINSMMQNPECRLADIGYLTDTEEAQLLCEFNNTYMDYPRTKTIHGMFEEQAAKTPDNIAVIFEEIQITYRELNDKANKMAEVFRKNGVVPGSIVGIMTDKSHEMLIALLAVLKCGAAYLPIDISYPADRVLYMLKDSGTKLLVSTSEASGKIPFTLLQNIVSDTANVLLTSPRGHIKDFNSLPIPDRSLIDITRYKNKISMASVNNCISLQTTRGCPYQCLFCHKVWSKNHVYRSAENIYSEIEYYYKKGVINFSILDDCFNLNAENGKRFFRMLIDNKIKSRILFPNGLRGDILTKDYIDIMAEAGVVNINLSLETASPRLQTLLKKYLNLEKFKDVMDYIATQHPGIILELATMHGFPTETEEEAMMTLDFIKEIKWIHFPYIHILKVYPNTEMEEFALKNGVRKEDILTSIDMAYHEIPDTLPFQKSFTRMYQSEFLNDYFLDKERLKSVLPVQMRLLNQEAIIDKYSSYLPMEIKSIEDILKIAEIDDFVPPRDLYAEDIANCSIFNVSKEKKKESQRKDAKRILFLDLSQHFSTHRMLYKVTEQPLGHLYILTYLNQEFGDKIDGKICKSGIDFDSFEELKSIVEEFKPDLIGIRTLSLYRDFFHLTVSLLRQWGIKCPVITGGPYATSDYNFILQDKNVDIAVIGEGEETLRELLEVIFKNESKVPDYSVLRKIKGIAFNINDSQDPTRKVLLLDKVDHLQSCSETASVPQIEVNADSLAYVMYTSGSTGRPKGVMVEHRQVNNCIFWMQNEFGLKESDILVQRTNLTFDPSVWEMFWPLYRGAATRLITIDQGKDAEFLIDMMKDGTKATVMYSPASLITGMTYVLNTKAEKPVLKMPLLFIGAEPISRDTVNDFYSYFEGKIVNTYGPTECTINNTYCYLGREGNSIVPIGKPVANNKIYILSRERKLLPVNIPGEIYIAGESLARGYMNNVEKTKESFLENLFGEGRFYKTGDIGRWLENGKIEIMGRVDSQVKIRGYRIELNEIENALMKNKEIVECAAIVIDSSAKKKEIKKCTKCSITNSYPDIDINEKGICNICTDYNRYKNVIDKYFKRPEDLDELIQRVNQNKESIYDCMLLYSGGKGSAHALYRLVGKGYKVLAITYDNGYFSQKDKKRIKSITEKLGVDHIFLTHPKTQEILTESLKSANTVCKGCFFTSQALALDYAKKYNIKIVIGATLSRGQIIENKLYKLIAHSIREVPEIEKEIYKMQQLTGQMNESIYRLINIDGATDGALFKQVTSVDFYRYYDMTNAEMLEYLNERDSYWTTRKNYAIYSTNCSIKQIGDFSHLHVKDFHYYGAATSWEKRLNHITMENMEQDLQCNVTQSGVENFMRRLGLEVTKPTSRLETKFICAYYVSEEEMTVSDLRGYLLGEIPDYMIPSYFIRLDEIPHTPEGKVSRKLLPEPSRNFKTGVEYAAPENETEEKMAEIWQEILGIEKIGINDNFFELGGHSIKATMLVSRVHKDFNIEIPLREIFKTPTIKELSRHIIN